MIGGFRYIRWRILETARGVALTSANRTASNPVAIQERLVGIANLHRSTRIRVTARGLSHDRNTSSRHE